MSSAWERLRAIIAEQLNVEPGRVTPDASFEGDLEADSLDRVELVMTLEEEFGIEITDEEAEAIVKVSDALAFIEQHAAA